MKHCKVILNARGEKAVLKLMFAAMAQASEKRRPIGVKGFERRQMEQIREELDEEYEQTTGPVRSLRTEACPS